MNLPEQEVSLATILRRIGIVTRDWGGTELDPEASMHLSNPAANRPPLFWCFNTAQEFTRLAEALGPEQPLVGLRSLNGVIDPSLTNSSIADALAKHYAKYLLNYFGTGACLIGGNCQAASIAYRVALHLLQANVPIARLVTLDAQLRVPYPGTMRRLFGRDSTYNPFTQQAPHSDQLVLRNWEYSSRGFDWANVDGSHGAYFEPKNIPSLAREIMRPSSALSASKFPPTTLDLVSSLSWRITQVDEGHVTLLAEGPEMPDHFALLPVWKKLDGSLFQIGGEDWVVPLTSRSSRTYLIPRPEEPGPWHFWPVLCHHGSGPVAWPLEKHQQLILC